jgi:uncharacterized membrane protein
MIGFIQWMLWNLFLAVLPVVFAYATAGLAALKGRRGWRWLILAPLLGLWLIFLPNSCYLFTEPVHLLAAVEQDSLWPRARHDPDAAVRLGLWTSVSLCYLAAGALTFALSIRPIEAWARRAGLTSHYWAAPFFVLMALGVYLGRIVRFNSWDLFTRPGAVLDTAAGLSHRPFLLAGIGLFGLFLWAAYLVVDIWLDGAAVRWQRWTRGGSPGSPAEWASATGSL